MSIKIIIDSMKEPLKYDIFSQLTKDGKAIIEETNKKTEWRAISQQLGKLATKTNGAILPPATTPYHNIGYVVTSNKKPVVITEEKIEPVSFGDGKKSRFIIDLKF